MERNYSGIESDMHIEKQMVHGIIQGMTYVHEHNILHRDLNPNNIFLDAQLRPKIGDFGMAIKSENNYFEQGTKLSSNLGVSLYMPPEYKLDGTYTQKSDVYSTGIVFIEILSYFKTDMERYNVIMSIKHTHHVELPDNLTTMIINMIDENPNNRPSFYELTN
jgi:translation initiation factor 2-alpha kinase 4